MYDPISDLIGAIDPARIRPDVDVLAAIHSRHVASGAGGIGAAADYIRSAYAEAGGRLRVSLDSFEDDVTRLAGRHISMANVVAELPGTSDFERLLVVGGHYDSRVNDITDATSRAPGANDDASGVALTLELARVLASGEWPCSLVFIAFTGEEMGLLGARHWALTARAANRDVVAMLNNDLVGNVRDFRRRLCDDRVRIFSEGMPSAGDQALMRRLGLESDSPSRQLARYVVETGARYLPELGVDLVMRPDRLGRGGDHLPFSNQGYPAVRFVEAFENYDRQHQNLREEGGIAVGDLPEFVSETYTARIARLNCAVMASLAFAPTPPTSVTLNRPVSHAPVISWRTEPGLTYAVRGRGTTSPVWEERVEVGSDCEYAICPDEVSDRIYAVEAMNTTGFRSLPVVTMPAIRR